MKNKIIKNVEMLGITINSCVPDGDQFIVISGHLGNSKVIIEYDDTILEIFLEITFIEEEVEVSSASYVFKEYNKYGITQEQIERSFEKLRQVI